MTYRKWYYWVPLVGLIKYWGDCFMQDYNYIYDPLYDWFEFYHTVLTLLIIITTILWSMHMQ